MRVCASVCVFLCVPAHTHAPLLTHPSSAVLMPPFQSVLELDIEEYTPYVFQVLAILLHMRKEGASDAYRALFRPLLNPTNWKNRGNVPALVHLMTVRVRPCGRGGARAHTHARTHTHTKIHQNPRKRLQNKSPIRLLFTDAENQCFCK